MSPARRALRASLAELGREAIPGPSLTFRTRLERHLIEGVDQPLEAGAPLAAATPAALAVADPAIPSVRTGGSPARSDLRASLAELGREPIPGPSLTFRARLERQLVGGADESPGATVLPLHSRPRRLVPVLSVGAATIAAVVLAAALFGAFGHGSPERLQLAAAVHTTVVLPDGRTVPGRVGLQLPDGAIVRTAANGRAAAGSVQLGPGLQGVINGGGIKIQVPPVQVPPVQVPTVTTPAVVPPQVPLPPVTLPLGLGH